MKNPTDTLNREQWLTSAATMIFSDLIAPHLHQPPAHPFRVSVGFPSGKVSKVVAQCWKAEASADSTNEIFVSPTVSDSIEVLASLTHELIHFADNCASGHRNHFARVARKVGLEGHLTATTAGETLSAQLNYYVELLGQIPHAILDPTLSGAKKQPTRMIKLECCACSFTCRATRSQIETLSTSKLCPACLGVGVFFEV